MEKGNLAEKLKKLLHEICEVLETITAVLMIVGILLAVVGMLRDTALFRRVLAGEGQFMEYIERVFSIVIGIEFLEMLCKPGAENVIQVLVFLVARHMIVGEATPVQNLISIVSIAILFVLERWLRACKTEPSGFAFPMRNREKKPVE